MKYFIFILFFIISLEAKIYQKLEFQGAGIDFLVGDFASSTLYKVIGKEYPPFYTPWRSDPTFDSKEIEEYKDRLQDYLESLGYYKATIATKELNDKIVVDINRGERIKVKRIKVHPDSWFKRLILFREGSYFDTARFTQSKKRIERYLQENGYPKYKFKAKAMVDLDSYRVDLDFFVDKNKTCYFGDTTIKGQGDVSSDIIQENIFYKKGERYDIRKVEKSYDKLYDLGVYDFITFDTPLENNLTELPIKLDLMMGDTKFVKGSIGYSTNEGARGSISWIDKNFFGNLKVFDIGFKATQIGYEAYNTFYNPRIILPFIGKIDFENALEYSRYRYESYTQTKVQNRVTFGKIAYGLEHYFGLLSEYSKIRAKSPDDINESGNYFLNSLFYRLLIDKRDSKLDAQNGYFIALYLEKSMQSIGSDIDYFKSTIDLRYIKSLSHRWVVGTKLRLGRIDADVPIFKRFYTGGANTNRGYDYRDFGQKDSAGLPKGGVSLVDTMIEARYRVWQKFWLTTFVDSSMLSLKPDSFKNRFYSSYGFGMRYKTVIGPIRVDFGFPKDEDDWTFHISIGQVF